jgi:hypothetical protein
MLESLSLGQGDYIQWFDADDLLSQDKIALQMSIKPPTPSVLFSRALGAVFIVTKARFIRRLWESPSNGFSEMGE